jgi:hypothetical protein
MYSYAKLGCLVVFAYAAFPASAQMHAPAGMTTSIFVEGVAGERLRLSLRHGLQTTVDADPQGGAPGEIARIPGSTRHRMQPFPASRCPRGTPPKRRG